VPALVAAPMTVTGRMAVTAPARTAADTESLTRTASLGLPSW
jgi:hypothetical protein